MVWYGMMNHIPVVFGGVNAPRPAADEACRYDDYERSH